MGTFEISSEQIRRNDHATIDVDNPYFPLVDSVTRELEILHPLSDQRSIYRVHKIIRQVNEQAYTPQLVSIGPLHHGREDLKPMEEHKRRYLRDFLQRTTVSLEDLFKLIKEKEARLRNCYAESIQLNSDDFVKLILVDTVFIIEILMRWILEEIRTRNDLIYDNLSLIFDIRLDMCLLENQLPFFILEDVFRLANFNIAMSFSLFELAHEFFKRLGLSVYEARLGNDSSPTVEHILDFLRICHQPSTSKQKRTFKTLTIPNVTELHQAGVKFKLASSNNIFDIRFNNGIMFIPKLNIRQSTEVMLKNFLAFERYHLPSNYIADYVIFINHLINAPKDVEVLVQNGIIENLMEKSEGVSTLFQNLRKDISLHRKNFYFIDLIEDLNIYCSSPWHKWKATLKQDYFNTPWAAISVIAAVILLILTIIQAVCSIISV